MIDVGSSTQTASVTDNKMLHIIYGLYAVTFLFTLAIIIGVILAYFQRNKTLSDMQRSHVDWQIRTFWWGSLFGLLVFASVFVLHWFPVVTLFLLQTIWFIYRIAKGWLRLKHGQPIDNPKALI